jgi:hypothetical protein
MSNLQKRQKKTPIPPTQGRSSMNAVTPINHTNAIAAVLQHNDLSKLSQQQKNDYYMGVCTSLGMNPMTRPFEFIKLGGREVLYAKRDAADQLRKINGISIEVVSRQVEGELMTVHVRAKDNSGRADEDFGVVTIAGLKGENLANAMLKAVTKAKRRVTLSISGLGFLDETEVADVPGAQPVAAQPPKAEPPPKVEAPVHPETGEVSPHQIPVPVKADGTDTDWMEWGKSYAAAIASSATLQDLDDWIHGNAVAMGKAYAEAGKIHARLMAIIDAKRLALVPKKNDLEEALELPKFLDRRPEQQAAE